MDGLSTVFVKGAPDFLLGRCDAIYNESGALVPLYYSSRAALAAALETLGRQGQRVLALCERPLPSSDFPPGFIFSTDPEPNFPLDKLALVGFVAISDPPRSSTAPAVAALREAGVQVVMVTGDAETTAEAIARQVKEACLYVLKADFLSLPRRPRSALSLFRPSTALSAIFGVLRALLCPFRMRLLTHGLCAMRALARLSDLPSPHILFRPVLCRPLRLAIPPFPSQYSRRVPSRRLHPTQQSLQQVPNSRTSRQRRGIGCFVTLRLSSRARHPNKSLPSSRRVTGVCGAAGHLDVATWLFLQAAQKNGQRVGVTGDGMNDAPALKNADVGVAMNSGSDAARDAAHAVLLTDDFSAMVHAVRRLRVLRSGTLRVSCPLASRAPGSRGPPPLCQPAQDLRIPHHGGCVGSLIWRESRLPISVFCLFSCVCRLLVRTSSRPRQLLSRRPDASLCISHDLHILRHRRVRGNCAHL